MWYNISSSNDWRWEYDSRGRNSENIFTAFIGINTNSNWKVYVKMKKESEDALSFLVYDSIGIYDSL